MPKINRDELNQFSYLAPKNIEEQQKIGSFFKQLDDTITLHQRKLSGLQQVRHWAEQNLLPEPNETAPKVRVGEFDGEWKSTIIGEFVIENETEKVDDASIDDVMTLGLNMSGLRKNSNRSLKLGATQYYRRHTGQLLYGKQNIFNGSLAIVQSEFDGLATSKDVPGFDLDTTKIDSEFLIQYLGRELFYHQLENHAVGIGSKRFHVVDFYKVSIGRPSMREQQAIAKVFTTIDARIKSEQQLIADLQEVKRWALNNMFI